MWVSPGSWVCVGWGVQVETGTVSVSSGSWVDSSVAVRLGTLVGVISGVRVGRGVNVKAGGTVASGVSVSSGSVVGSGVRVSSGSLVGGMVAEGCVVASGVKVGTGVRVSVGTGVPVCVGIGVRVAVRAAVFVGRGVSVAVAGRVGVRVAVGVAIEPAPAPRGVGVKDGAVVGVVRASTELGVLPTGGVPPSESPPVSGVIAAAGADVSRAVGIGPPLISASPVGVGVTCPVTTVGLRGGDERTLIVFATLRFPGRI